MATTAAQFISERGDAAIAKAAGVPLGTVRVWKHRNSIPRSAWPELLQAFPDDVSVDDLKALEPAK